MSLAGGKMVILSSFHADQPVHVDDCGNSMLGAGTTPEKVSVRHCCDKCSYQSPHRHALDRHNQSVHERLKIFDCPSCPYRTSHGSAFKRHVAKIHNRVGQETFTCDTCDYQTLHKSALKRHQAQKHNKDGLVSYQCSVCCYSSTYEFALSRHMSTVHLKQGGLACPLCDYTTVHKQSLERHVRVVHEKAQSHACSLCEYRSAHRATLKMHVATVHNAKEAFRCDKCGFETLYKTALARHKSTVSCGSSCKGVGAGNLMKQEEAESSRRSQRDEERTEEMVVDSRLPQPQDRKEILHCVVISGQSQELALGSNSSSGQHMGYCLEEGEATAHAQYTGLALIHKDNNTWQQILNSAERSSDLTQMVEISGSCLQQVYLQPASQQAK